MKRRAFPWFLLFVTAYVAVLGWGWLRQQPSNEELLGYAGKIQATFEQLHAHGWSWWTPAFLTGFSGAATLGYALAMIPYWLAMQALPAATALKVAGLVLLALGALAAWLFGRRLTGSAWTACAIGVAYLLSPQLLLRLGWQEHMTIVAAYPLVPLAFLALLRVAERGSPMDATLLAIFFSAALLCWSKVGATLVLPLGLFALWLFFTRPETRLNLLRGAAWAVPLTLLLAVLPLLPLVREFRFMTIFDLDPFAGWQAAYSAKTAASWLDRGGDLFAGLPRLLRVDRGGYYLGFAGLAAVAFLIFRTWKRPEPSREIRAARCFIGIGLVLFWISLGPRNVVQGHFEFLSGALQFPDWGIPLPWLLLLAQALVIYWLMPPVRGKPWFYAGLLAVYLLVPAFRLLEWIPLYANLRAPDSFWMLNGALAWAVASGIAAAWAIRKIRPIPLRAVVALALLALASWDSSANARWFFKRGLPATVYRDFDKAAEFLKSSPAPGRVMALSGRYFYLQIPALTGRPLSSEAAHHNFMLADMARLQAAAQGAHSAVLAGLRIGGISHVLLDRNDPDLPAGAEEWFSAILPKVFENGHFLIFENRDALYPAFYAKRGILSPAGDKAQALRYAESNTLALSPSGEITPQQDVPSQPGPAFKRLPAVGSPRPDTIELATGHQAGWVVLSEAWHPDWTVTVNGEPRPVVLAAGAFPAVAVEAGDSLARFHLAAPVWYNATVIAGFATWAVSLIALAGIPISPRRFRHWWSGSRESRTTPGNPLLPRTPIRRPLAILPTYNEAATIGAILDRILSLPESVSALVVDDGSPDGTADAVRKHPAFGTRLFLLERTAKLGLGSAYRAGFRWAIDQEYDACIEIDADLSHDPSDIPRLLAALNGGLDAAIGSRYVGGVRVLNWPQHRLLLSLTASRYVRLLTGLPLTDATSGFKAIRVSALEQIERTKLRAEGYGFQIELHWLLWTGGFRIAEVPIVFTERREGQTKMTASIAIEAAWRVLQLALHHPGRPEAAPPDKNA